jgi:formate-dependent nitrite reductase membrane component NrfD
LIADLGRPSRFVNMLRVFRPTSPMNMGSWLLAVYGPAAGASAVLGSSLGAGVAGVAGVPLAGYTGVLVASTAVPAWQDASASMPALFTASGVAGAASLLMLGSCDDETAAVLRRYGIAGKVGELVAAAAVEREVKDRTPYTSTPLWRLSHLLTTISLILSLPRLRNRAREVVAALSGAAGSATIKFAVSQAGHESTGHP